MHFRNLETGEVRDVVPFSEEHLAFRADRGEDGHYLWESTSAADADPENHAHPDEVTARRRWGVTPLSFVTADGTPTSKAAAVALAKVDPGSRTQPVPGRDPANPAAGPKAPEPEPVKKPPAKAAEAEG